MNKRINNILVVKVGTSTLTKTGSDKRHSLDIESFNRIGKQVTALRQNGYSVVIVSSGAITAGMAVANVADRPENRESSMPTLQGLASIGWRHVLNAWDQALEGVVIGELLITRHELELTSERSELLKVAHNLLANGHIVVVNENDAITHEEIAFGDNDTLASTFASKLKQSELFGEDISIIILSDVDGVYADVNNRNTLLAEIEDIDAYAHVVSKVTGGVGTGGMATKFAAARIAKEHAIDMYITNGRMAEVLDKALSKKTGTYFKG